MAKKQKTRKLTVRVTPQTAFNLEKLMQISGQKTPGRVVDKLVREKMLALRLSKWGQQEWSSKSSLATL